VRVVGVSPLKGLGGTDPVSDCRYFSFLAAVLCLVLRSGTGEYPVHMLGPSHPGENRAGPTTPPSGQQGALPPELAQLLSGSTPADIQQQLGLIMSTSPFERAQPVPSRRRTPRDEVLTYRIRIDLNGAKSPIWRRVELSSDLTLDRVHDILQTVMGWTDSHLHEFISGKTPTDRLAERYLPQDSLDEDMEGVEESSVRLDEVLVEAGDWLFYSYDFGDNWSHTLRLEAVVPRGPDQPTAICLAGARACPPEDCGGIWGYGEVLRALKTPGDSGDAELLEWVGPDYDPEHFDVDDINSSLGHLDTIHQASAALASIVDPNSALGDLMRRLGGRPDDLGRAIVTALDPVPDPDRETKAEIVRSYQLLLNLVGDAGITLTQAGYLPPALVEAVAEILHLDNSWIGKFNRESQTYPVLDFRETAQRLGLLRKAHNKLTLTKAGAKARNNVDTLWKLVTAALPLGLTTRGAEVRASQDAGLLLLVAVGAGLPKPERLPLVASGLVALGWRTEPFQPLDDHDVRELSRPTKNVLEQVGAIPRWTFTAVTPAQGPPPEAVKAFAQAALRP